jgi:hypothetical protein
MYILNNISPKTEISVTPESAVKGDEKVPKTNIVAC